MTLAPDRLKAAVQARAWRFAVRAELPLRFLYSMLNLARVRMSRLLRRLPGTSWRIGPPRYITVDSPTWAIASVTKYVEVDQEWVAQRALPDADGHTIPGRFVDAAAWVAPRTFVLELERGRVWGPQAAPIAADDTVLADLTLSIAIPAQALTFGGLWLGRPRPIAGVTATIMGGYADSYHHWMFDLLPRLDILRRSRIGFDRLIVPGAHGFQRETLDVAAVPAETRIVHIPGTYLELERLLVPSLPNPIGHATEATCRFLRGLFPDETVRSGTRRLYLSRGDTNRRQVTNEDAIVAALEPLGFESVTMSGRSVAEQAALFAEAEVVVAPHGGALTNIVFCQRGTKVVELFSHAYTPPVFWTIACAVELDYRPLFYAHPAHDFPGGGAGAQWRPYVADPDRILRVLGELGVR